VDDGAPFAAPFRSLFQTAMSTTAPPAPPPSVAGRVANDAPMCVEAYLDHERSAPKERSEYLDEEHIDMLYEPVSIIEVLSPSTGDYDRGEKVARSRRLDTLQDYVLVSQDAVYAEHSARQSGDGGLLREIRNLDAALELDALQATVALRNMYRGVFDALNETPDENASDASSDR